jgi:hypothetical protein
MFLLFLWQTMASHLAKTTNIRSRLAPVYLRNYKLRRRSFLKATEKRGYLKNGGLRRYIAVLVKSLVIFKPLLRHLQDERSGVIFGSDSYKFDKFKCQIFEEINTLLQNEKIIWENLTTMGSLIVVLIVRRFSTNLPLQLFPRRGSRGISDIPSRRPPCF